MKKYFIISLIFIAHFTSAYSFRKLTILTDVMAPRTGPFFVRQSLISGLSLLDIPFNINPPSDQVGDAVAVISGVKNLRTAIQWKASGKISCLVGGPNIMNSPKEFNYLFAQKELDACLVPSYWIQIAYEEDAPSLKGRIRLWFSGIDTDYWKPTQSNKAKVLVYWKTEPEFFCKQVESLLHQYGYETIRVRYGSYTQETYRNILNQSQFAVFITRSESQGIALAEAWAMDVPTLNFDPGSLTYRGKVYSIVSSCPYLSEDTGKTWKEIGELEALLQNYKAISQSFNAREWMLKNMTNQASALQLISIIDDVLK
jgi:hypothetical protein